MAKLTLTPGATAILTVEDGYHHREALKARGYKFQSNGGTWLLTVTDAKSAAREIVWADDSGFEVRCTRGGINVKAARAAIAA